MKTLPDKKNAPVENTEIEPTETRTETRNPVEN